MKFKRPYLFQRNPSSKVQTMWVQLVALKVLSIMREIFLITFAKKGYAFRNIKADWEKNIADEILGNRQERNDPVSNGDVPSTSCF